MSATSTVTTLVAHNCIPGDEVELLNHTCVLALTGGDGTLFDAASIQEEDNIEICIQLGQTHPKGVLQYSAVKSVILFHSTDEMLVTACGVVKATALCKEPIRLRTSPPSATHVRAFMAVRDGEPSGTQPLTPDGEEPLPSPNDSPPRWEDPMSTTGEPWGPWGFQARAAHGGPLLGGHSQGTKHAPRDPTLTPWGKSSGKWETWCGWPGGYLPERGGWEPRGQPLWPLAPTQPDEYVGCLINTLATGLELGTPCINTFSSKAMLGKTEVSFNSSGTMRYNAWKTNIWNQWSGRVLYNHYKGQQQVWPGTWALPPVWPISYKS